MRLRFFLFGFIVALILAVLFLVTFQRVDRAKTAAPPPIAPAPPPPIASAPPPAVEQPATETMAPAPSLSVDDYAELQRVIDSQQKQLRRERDARMRAERALSESELPPPAVAPPPPPVAMAAPSPAPVVAPEIAPVPDATSVTYEESEECANDKPCRVKVFFATDRKRVDAARVPERFRMLKHYFGGDRELDPKVGLQLGECFVTIPRTHYQKYSGKLDYAGTYDPETSIFVKDIELSKSQDDWIESLNRRIEKDRDHEMLVFIHGYNVTFIDALRRTAQIYFDLGFKGAPVVYSWPSGGNLWNYWADEASVEWSAEHLRDFLDMLAKRSHAKRIHLIAHSMGSRALTHALSEIGARNAASARPECKEAMEKFQEVILAAPDLDTDLFLQLEAGIKNAAKRITLYASTRDRAVLASWILHRFRRLGVPGKTPPPEIDAIDASAASNDILGHSYYGESVLWDVKLMFEKPDLPIEKRCTVKREATRTYYTFLPQPKAQPPRRITRLVKSIFRRPGNPEAITTTCPLPSAAPAGGG